MFCADWNTCADLASAVATTATAFIAGFALWFARRQIHSSEKISREASALEAYREYLRLCFDFPEYSSSELALETIGRKSFIQITAKVTRESEKYLWFVGILLNSAEQILHHATGQEAWRSVLKSQLSYHTPVLKVIWPDFRFGYSRRMQRLVDEVLANARKV